MVVETTSAELLEQVVADLEAGNQEAVSQKLEEAHPAEVASLLEALPPEQRSELWEKVPTEQGAEVLTYLHEEARASIIDEMDEGELIAAAGTMAPEDLAELIDELPQDRGNMLMEALDRDHRGRLEAVLNYEEESAGRLMSTDVISVRADVTIAVVLRWLRRHERLPPHTDSLMVIDESGLYLGKLDLGEVLTSPPERLVGVMMQSDAVAVRACMNEHEVAMLFERRDLISVAVLNQDGLPLGRITIDDIVDVLREEHDRALLSSAGLSEEEDLFAPVLPSARRRGLWLGINLITIFAAAWVIGRFEEALDKIVALAVLMPVVASMGGIAGSQTLTLTIRGLALDQIAAANVRWLTSKELLVGAVNGLVWALAVALISYLWFRDPGISAIIAGAMLLNLLAAAFAGVVIPLLLDRWGIDPALSGAVILTTVTDIIGFLSFLGLASLFLL
ncbi:MAG: magnesium transporter [Candidatus Sedimenticola endophacoides]|nr:MAG: magnesium transporter [Candidatus Sedimenticola endophacoides]OQX33268.1 MAG: magnesium transporter [Candidatus Sedimenticola endophacoides]OQX42427.1 MAG: magnesium transporter [Candidatus Sedimenticola endophacoides]OQX44690.1 MAG: magnesium transporter [Candidatus Sedimenticola endophacoides]